MPRGIPNKPASAVDDTIRIIMSEKAAELAPAAPEPESMAVVRLDRNYRPMGHFEVVR